MGSETEQLFGILKDVNPEQSFWINNGPIIRNIYELASAIENMEDQTFVYHVNEEKNDFSVWINGVLNDEKLASSLLKIRDKKKYAKKIFSRISEIEKELDKARKVQAAAQAAQVEAPVKETETAKKTFEEKEFSMNRIFLELIVSFVLGIIVGIVIGVLVEHYTLIPGGWF